MLRFLSLLLYFLCCKGFYTPFRSSFIRISQKIKVLEDEKFDLSSNFVDITPEKNGGVLKKLITRGNGIKGYPQTGDIALIDWVMYDEDHNILHDSIDLDETFHFTLGVKYQVIPAFETAVRTMYEGETTMLYVKPEYGFGMHGDSMFKPNQTLFIELTLEELVIGIRQYETVKEDFDITKEIQQKIEAGELDPSEIPEAVVVDGNREKIKSSQSESIPEQARIPANPIPLTNPQQQALKSNTFPSVSPSDKKTNRRFFDPEKDKLDPNRTIQGIGEGHIWDENIDQIVLEVGIPDDLEKKDISVEISSWSLYIASLKGDFEFGGELQGKINPSECTWLIDGDDPSSHIRGKRLVFSLQKAASGRDLWGSFFNRKILEETIHQR